MTKCVQCREQFTRRSMTDKTCSRECKEQYVIDNAIKAHAKRIRLAEKAEKMRLKNERLSDRQRRDALKSKAEVEKEVERVVNEYIRERDKDLPCISCGAVTTSCWQAGHYVSVGANKTIRFEPENINRQCYQCNCKKGGNPIPYRINLIKKIGLERVEWLEGPHTPRHYTKEDLQGLKVCFREKLKELKNGR